MHCIRMDNHGLLHKDKVFNLQFQHIQNCMHKLLIWSCVYISKYYECTLENFVVIQGILHIKDFGTFIMAHHDRPCNFCHPFCVQE
jgi:hypothetical protein